MFKSYRTAIAIAGLLAVSAQPGLAHHSNAPHFDASKPVKLEGVVTQFSFVNPHAYIYVDVTDDQGVVTNWNCEMMSAGSLRRRGWTAEVIPAGVGISLEGIAARRDPNGCSLVSAVLKNGTTISRGGRIQTGALANAAPPASGGAATNEASATALAASTNAANPAAAFTGKWISSARGRGRGARQGGGAGAPQNAGARGGGGGRPGIEAFEPLMTDAGKAGASKYDDRFDDPALQCSPSSIVRGWQEPNSPSEVSLNGNQLIIKHEYMDTVRRIDLSTREHPAAITTSLTGHSVGWMEGDTLVIDTVGFEAGVLIPHPGVVNTTDMRIVERLTISSDGRNLLRSYEVTDPAYLRAPITGNNSWDRSDVAVSEYDCTELSGVNNVRP